MPAGVLRRLERISPRWRVLREKMYHDDDDDEEEFDEEEDEYVYKRDAAPKAADIDDLLRAPVVHHAPVVEQLPVKQAEPLPKLPQEFLREATEIKSIKGVTVTFLPKGATITIPGVPKNFTSPTLIVRADVNNDYPKSALKIDLLPPKDLVFQEVSLLPRLTQAILARCSGKPALVEIVKALYEWLRDPSIKEQLIIEDMAEKHEKQEALERERLTEKRKMEEIRERTALGLLPVWEPLTAAEESQRSPITGSAPCKIVNDLDLPNANFVTAARVGGKVYFYGGSLDATTLSDTLHIMHIASRRVEEHTRPTSKTTWPHRLTGHASCAVGHMVYVFGGRGADKLGYNNNSLTLKQSVWELNTRTLEWHRGVVDMPQGREHCTATPINNREIVIIGGCGSQQYTNACYFNDVLVYDRISATWRSPAITAAGGKLPAERYGHSAVLWQGKIIIYGGRGYSLHSDVWVLDVNDWKWYGPLATTDLDIPGRAFHSACLLGGQIIIYGGEYGTGRELNQMLIYDILARKFSVVQLNQLTEPRAGHVAFITGGTMLVAGGAQSKLERAPRAYYSASTLLVYMPVKSALAIALAPAPIAVPSSRLIQDLADLRTASSGSFTDILLGPSKIPLHSLLLVARCPALATAVATALAAPAPVPFRIPELTSTDSNQAFVDYLYTGNPFASLCADDISEAYLPDVCDELTAAARKLELPTLTVRVTKPPHPEESFYGEALNDLAGLAAKPPRADFTLVAGTKRMPVYRALLACRSEYFRAMLAAGMSETRKGEMLLPASLSDTAAAAFANYVLTDDLDPNCAEHVMELLPFADLVQLPRLQRAAERLITDAYDLNDLDSLLALTVVADVHSPTLLSRCLFLLVQHFTLKRAMESEAWSVLSPELQLKAKKLAGEA